MGKIVATGGISIGDDESRPIIKYIVSQSRNTVNPHVVYLPTASFDVEDDLDYIAEVFGEYGCTLEALYLTDEKLTEEDIKNKILSADIIFAGGGNLKFLMDTWTRTNAVKYLKEAYEKDIVLSGTSSGAMCWFARGYDDCGEDHAFMFVDCLGLVPYCNCPHYHAEYWQTFNEAVKTQDLSGIAIENDIAVCFIDNKIELIRGDDTKNAYFFSKEDNFKRTEILGMV